MYCHFRLCLKPENVNKKNINCNVRQVLIHHRNFSNSKLFNNRNSLEECIVQLLVVNINLSKFWSDLRNELIRKLVLGKHENKKNNI